MTEEKTLEAMLQEINALLEDDTSPDIEAPDAIKAAPTGRFSELYASDMEAIEGENATQRLQDLVEVAQLPGVDISILTRISEWQDLIKRLHEVMHNIGTSLEGAQKALRELKISLIKAHEHIEQTSRRLPFAERKHRHPLTTPRMPARIRSATHSWDPYRPRDRGHRR